MIPSPPSALGAFLRGAVPNPARPKAPPAPAVARLLALPLAERREFFTDGLFFLDWWLRGRMMQAEGYLDDADAPREEATVARKLRAVAPLLVGPPADPDAAARFFRAVVAPDATLPPGGWPSLPGRVWRTALRPLQSWTDSLDSARAFARSGAGRRFLRPGASQFVVEAEVPARRVLFRYADLEAALRDVALGAGKLDTRTRAPAWGEFAAHHYHLVRAKGQREVVLDLPRGEVLVAAVHAVEG